LREESEERAVGRTSFAKIEVKAQLVLFFLFLRRRGRADADDVGEAATKEQRTLSALTGSSKEGVVVYDLNFTSEEALYFLALVAFESTSLTLRAVEGRKRSIR
jgi:hypothetical protein